MVLAVKEPVMKILLVLILNLNENNNTKKGSDFRFNNNYKNEIKNHHQIPLILGQI